MGILTSRLYRRIRPLGQTDNVQEGLYSNITISSQFVVVWLDADISKTDAVYQTSINYLQRCFKSLQTFTKTEDCLKYLSSIQNETVLLVVSSELLPKIWSHVKNMSYIHSIYVLIFSGQRLALADCDSPKIRAIFNRVSSVYSTLKRGSRYTKLNSLVMSVIPSQIFTKIDLSQLNQLFVYGMLMKQIILEMKYDHHQAMIGFGRFCRSQYFGDQNQLKIIKEFEKNYKQHTPIWWYTRDCFVSTMLTRAFQTQDIETIIRFGFFIKDLHQQIETIHSKTMKKNNLPIVVYRTQHVSKEEFEKMKNIIGHLVAFNNFLLADPNYDASLESARRTCSTQDGISILFRLKIESQQTSNPLASLQNVSFSSEKSNCILFSMHSIFRVNNIKNLEHRLWEVDLTLTDANNEHIRSLTQLLKLETQYSIGWDKLAQLMIILRDYDLAREIYFALLELTPEDDALKLAHIYNELGILDDATGRFASALQFYQKSIGIRQELLPPNHRLLSVSYNNIGEVQRQMGDYFSALSTHKKTLDIKQQSLQPWDLSFATTYNNIGLTSGLLGEYKTALEFYQKALTIKLRVYSHDHPELAICYNNIGELQRAMGNYPAALSSFERALKIRLKIYSSMDPSLAILYNNIGLIHRELGDFNQGINYLEKSLEVKRKHFPPNHPSFATTYNNIGGIRHQMAEFDQALAAFQTALDIQQKTLPSNHPEMATTLTNIGVTHQSLGNYKESLEFYEKALAIRKKTLPKNHPTIGTSYNNIGHVHQLLGEYTVANKFYQRTLKIQEESLSSDHPMLSATYNNLADIQRELGNFEKALDLYKKSLEIKRKTLPSNHPTLVTTYNNMGVVHRALKQYAEGLECFNQTLEIQRKTLPPNHPDLAAVYANIGSNHQSLQEHSKAIEYYEKALKIQEKSLPNNHPDLAMTYNSIATVLVVKGDFKKALEHAQKAVDIGSQSLPPDHPHLLTFIDYLARIQAKVESLNSY